MECKNKVYFIYIQIKKTRLTHPPKSYFEKRPFTINNYPLIFFIHSSNFFSTAFP